MLIDSTIEALKIFPILEQFHHVRINQQLPDLLTRDNFLNPGSVLIFLYGDQVTDHCAQVGDRGIRIVLIFQFSQVNSPHWHQPGSDLFGMLPSIDIFGNINYRKVLHLSPLHDFCQIDGLIRLKCFHSLSIDSMAFGAVFHIYSSSFCNLGMLLL